MKSKKALFMDFYGTVVAEISPIAREVIMDVYQNSIASSPREGDCLLVQNIWRKDDSL